jgi:hypothetical protein
MPTAPRTSAADDLPDVGHPRGTLAIVIIYAALFAIGFFAMFLFRFMERGAPHHH